MEEKSSTQMVRFLPDVCQLRSRKTIFAHVSEREFFPPNCRTFAVEGN